MAFEGNPISIPIRGIVRAGADGAIADGGLQDIVGLVYKDGSYVPYAPGATDSIFHNELVNIRVHNTTRRDDDENVGVNVVFVVKVGNNYVLEWVSKENFDKQNKEVDPHDGASIEGWGDSLDTIITTESFIGDIEFVGNMLCVQTDSIIKYYLFDGSNYVYQDIAPESLPTVDFQVTRGLPSIEGKNGVEVIECLDSKYFVYSSNGEMPTLDEKTFAADIIKAKGEVTRRGGLTGYVLATYAWRLKNGNFVYASAPILLGRPDKVYEDSLHDITGSTSFSYPTNATQYVNGADMYKDAAVLFPFGKVHKATSGNWIVTTDLDGESSEEIPSTYVTRELKFYSSSASERDARQMLIATNLVSSSLPIAKVDSEMPKVAPYQRYASVFREGKSAGSGLWSAKYDIYSYQVSNKLRYRINGSFHSSEMIESLCLFISPEIDPFEPIDIVANNIVDNIVMSGQHLSKHAQDSQRNGYSLTTYTARPKTWDKIKDDIKGISNMYLVKEIPVEELEATTGFVELDLKGKLGDNLLVRESLDATAFNYRKTTGKLSTYNDRLHVFDYKQTLFGGYALDSFIHHGGAGQKQISQLTGKTTVEVDIYIRSNDNGESKIVSISDSSVIQNAILQPMLSYPDTDAYKMVVYFNHHLGATYTKKERTFLLEKNELLGISYFLFDDAAPADLVNALNESSKSIPVSTTHNDIVYLSNGLKVSDAQFPMYLPAGATTMFNCGRVIGLGRMGIPMTYEMFGSYPLLAFLDNGICALEVDTTGELAYKSVKPFSNEVCAGRKSICEIDGSIVFASSKGLMLASGNGVSIFAPELIGKPKNLPRANTEYNDSMDLFYRAVTNNHIVSLIYEGRQLSNNQVSNMDILEMMNEDFEIHYVPNKNGLLMFNKKSVQDGSTYFMDIVTRVCTKINNMCGMGDKNYPKELFHSEDAKCYEFKYNSSALYNDCMFLTRAIKLNEKLKGTLRVVLRGRFQSVFNGCWAELHVYGSLDGINWTTLGVKEKELVGGGFMDLGTTVHRASVNYILVMFAGRLSPESHIDALELSYKQRTDNQL